MDLGVTSNICRFAFEEDVRSFMLICEMESCGTY